MTPPSMESIFLILSGVILVAGVLYWLWSHIQLTQKKVQLLENAVFELRGMLSNSGGGAAGPGAPASPTRQVQVIPATAATAAAFEHMNAGGAVDDTEADWAEDGEHKSTPLAELNADAPVLETHEIAGVEDDLQPGGRAAVGTMEIDLDAAPVVDDDRADEFRKLFVVQHEKSISPSPAISAVSSSASVAAEAPAPSSKTPESLESMPVKELRRLAEQRGIAGAADMRKKEILAALRQQVTMNVTLSDAQPAVAEADDDVKEVAINSAEILE